MYKKIKEAITKKEKIAKLIKDHKLEKQALMEKVQELEDKIKHLHTEGLYEVINNPHLKIRGLTLQQIDLLKRHYSATTAQDPEKI